MSSSNIDEWSHVLSDRVVFIAGAGGHVSRNLVKTCYAQGARLVLGDLDPALMHRVIDELSIAEEKKTERILVVKLDITNETSIEQAVQLALDKWKTIDVLLNVSVYSPTLDSSFDFFF